MVVWLVLFGYVVFDFEWIYFYSDLINDVLLFDYVMYLVVINFDVKFFGVVGMCGWFVMKLF